MNVDMLEVFSKATGSYDRLRSVCSLVQRMFFPGEVPKRMSEAWRMALPSLEGRSTEAWKTGTKRFSFSPFYFFLIFRSWQLPPF